MSFYPKSIQDYERGHDMALIELATYNPRVSCNEQFYLKRKHHDVEIDVIFTTSTGVYHYTGTTGLSQIAQGTFYGLAHRDNHWYVTRSNQIGKRNFLLNERFSHIYQFSFTPEIKPILKPVIQNIPKELHQIDFVNKSLIIPHTGYPQLLKATIKETSANEDLSLLNFTDVQCFQLPLEEFCHLNSVYHRDNKYYIIAHNYTAKSGKMSDMIVTDENFDLIEIIYLDAHSAHNIFFHQDEIIFCDSQNKKLRSVWNVYFEADLFLRGLSVNSSHIYLGGSPVNMQTFEEVSGNSKIYVLNREFQQVDEIEVSGIGKIYEIRQSSGFDLAMSQ
jgi:hypothetical protein